MTRAPIPQQTRAVQTRDALVAAAVDCLAEGGVAATATARVARRAGVSQGALFRHFPAKNDLLEAAVARVLDALFLQFEDAMPAPTPDGDRLEVGLAALWTVYTDPRLAGVFELFLAARTDPDLQARLSPILLAHAERELALARQIFPQAAHRDDFDAVVIGLLSTLQGAAVASWALPGEAGTRELAFLTQLIRRELRAPDAAPEAP